MVNNGDNESYNLEYLKKDKNGILFWKEEKKDELVINPFPFFISKTIEKLDFKFTKKKIFKKYNLNFLIFISCITVLFAILNVSVSFYEGTLILHNGGDGYFQDFVNWSHIIVIGLIIIIFKKLYQYISIFFKEISKVIEWSKNFSPYDLIKMKEKTEKMIRGEKYYLIVLIFFISMGFFLSYHVTYISQIDRVYDIWHSFNHPLGLTTYFIFNTITLGIILPIISYQFLTTAIMIIKIPKELSQAGALNLIPVEPNDSGGLYICGKINLLLYYIILTPMIFVFTGVLRQVILAGPENQELGFLIYIPFYLIPLFGTFIIPITSIHFSMKKSKQNCLEKISNNHNYNFKIYKTIPASHDSKRFLYLKKLSFYKDFYDVMSNCPEWPISINNTIRNFFIPLLLSYIIPYIFSLSEELLSLKYI